jgi:hypothetical protein
MPLRNDAALTFLICASFDLAGMIVASWFVARREPDRTTTIVREMTARCK